MPDMDAMTEKRVVYEIPDMEQAQVRENIVYKTVNERELKMDVYYPANFQFDTQLPAVVFVHGDAPSEILKNAKDWGSYVSWAQLVAASGLIAITSTHRSTDDVADFYEVTTDLDDLIFQIHKQAESLFIDKNALGIWTASAGVPFGLRAAMHESPEWVRCIVAYYGTMDTDMMRDVDSSLEELEHLTELSGIYHLTQNPMIAPLFIAKAGLDSPERNDSIDKFVAEALAKNVSLTLMTHPEGQHGFDIVNDDARSREIIRATLDFIRTYLVEVHRE